MGKSAEVIDAKGVGGTPFAQKSAELHEIKGIR
jgi:hypothetical protein